MKKKSTPIQPVSPDQLNALRRLARSGKVQEALDRLDALKTRNPDFKPLYSLAWELADMADSLHWAVGRALDWTQVSPNSRAAWQALLDSAYAGGYMALGLHAGMKIAMLEGKAVEPVEDLDTPFGKMCFEEALANDKSRVFMANGRLDQALVALAGFDHVSLSNNAGLIRFHQGDVAGALAAFEENWQREPRNLFALESIIRLRLWTHGRDFAAGLSAPMMATPAVRSDDALAKVTALLILGDWQGADAAWCESADADFWQGLQEIDKSQAFHFAGGIAAMRLGDLEAMSERFDDAIHHEPSRRDLVERIEHAAAFPALGDAPDLALMAVKQWFPQAWVARFSEVKTYKGKETEDRYDDLLRRCDAHPNYLGIVAELGDEAGRFLAISILKLRAKGGDEAAKRALISLLARPCGTDKVRTGLHADLVDAGLLPEGGTVSMLAQGKVREIRHLALKIHAEASPPSLPPESHARLEKVFGLIAKQRLAECLTILEDLIVRHPGVPLLYHNLAGIKEGLKHPEAEIEDLLQKSHALDPDYLFAIAGLARLAAQRGEIDRAKEMLEPLLGRVSYHFAEWRSILLAQIELARGEGEYGAVYNLEKQIDALQERFS